MSELQRKLPYLCRKPPSDGAIVEDEWLQRRDDKRKSYCPANWSNYFRKGFQVDIRNGDKLGLWTSHSLGGEGDSQEAAFILMLHGGGYSGLTWAPLVDELSRLIVAEYGALDLRGHGESECADENSMSLDTLTQDVVEAVDWMKGSPVNLGTRPLVLIGHSMGGALAVNVALQLQDRPDVNLVGLVVLDVVEGTALAALSSMRSVLRGRPQSFASLSEGIQWCVRSGQTKNIDSARISMLGQLKPMQDKSESSTSNGDSSPVRKKLWEPIDGEGALQQDVSESDVTESVYVWRTDLHKTEQYWRGWFEGLSKKFLTIKCPKLLMLAGVDRLDKDMMVGQMQGKFQMQVFHQVGHAVHEDAPDKAAESIAGFLQRQKIVQCKTRLTPHLPGC